VMQNLDLLAVKFTLPAGQIVVGRQVLSWGTGHYWNPTDLLSPFAPTEIDREVRHGIDAVRFSLPLSATSLVDVLWLPRLTGWEQGAVARAQANLRGFDFSVSAAKYIADLVLGADFAGDLGPVAIHGEAAYTWGLAGLGGRSVTLGDQFLRAVAGADWKPVSHLMLTGEFYFNGFGAATAAGYLAKLTSPRETTGEISGAGRYYFGLGGSWSFTDLASLSAFAIANLQDPSCELVPVFEWWFEQNVIVRAGGYVPIGQGPDTAAIARLTPQDLATGSPAFASALSTFGLRSEYGTGAAGLFVQVGLYY